MTTYSDDDSLKENFPPYSNGLKKESKRMVPSSADEETTAAKRPKLNTADQVLATEDVIQDESSDSEIELPNSSQRSYKNSKKTAISSDSENEATSPHYSSQSSHSQGSSGSRSSVKRLKRKKKQAKIESDSESEEEATLSSGRSHIADTSTRLLTSTLDPDLFDAEESSDGEKSAISDKEKSPVSDEEIEGEVVNKLSSRFSGPAAKKESKTVKRAAKQDEKMKIYSEKQRMIREQKVSIPVYQPQKKSLREFLGEQAPQLLCSLRNHPKEPPLAPAPKRRHSEKPYRPPKRLEELNYLKSNSILYTPDKHRVKADVILETPPADETDVLPVSKHDTPLATVQSQLLPTPEEEEDDELPDLLSEVTKSKADTQFNKEISESESEEKVIASSIVEEDNAQLTDESPVSQPSSAGIEVPSQSCALSASGSQSASTCLMSQPSVESRGPSSQSADNSQATCETTSCVTVVEKTSPMRRRIEEKKLKLRQLLGDTVDLDVVPQLTCDMDGVVVLDDQHLVERQHFTKFKTSFERKAAKAQQMEEERKRQREKKALRVVRSLPDGSQHEISMDAYSNKTAEETGGVHKLAVLKQILKAKISEKRNEELKQKEETIKMEALEELPEDEILEDDYEFSDDEKEEKDDSDSEIGPVLHTSDTESRSKCQIEQDEALMRRVRAVLESDDEEEDAESSTQPAAYSLGRPTLAESHMLDSLDRILDDQSSTMKSSSNTLSSKHGSMDDSEAKHVENARKPVNPVDENAQDVNTGFTFCPEKSNGISKSVLGFTQGMFSTQQAEEELEGLCSGRFGTPQHDTGNEECQTQASANNEQVESDATTKVLASKKKALHFSDEEESDTEQLSDIKEEEEALDEEEDELDQLEDESEEESEVGDSQLEGEEKGLSDAASSNKLDNQTLFLQKPRQTKREKMMGEFLDEQAELSGEEGGSDEDLDFGAEADVLELEKGDLDHVGNEEELRSQIAKAHTKQRVDDDARQLMLMKEMLLPDGDLHSDSTRQRKFRWRNVEYGSEAIHATGDSDGSEASDEDEDSTVRELQEKLEKERAEREAWLKDQRDSQIQLEMEESQSQFADESQDETRPAAQQTFTFDLTKKRKKPSYILGKSKRYLERFKELHKNINEEQRGPVSHKNLVFRPISKEDAESQQEMMWNKS